MEIYAVPRPTKRRTPPLLALAERNQGPTALIEYLRRLQDDRIALVDEVDRLRAETAEQDSSKRSP